MGIQMVCLTGPEAGRRPRHETGRRRAIRNPHFGGEFLERKLSPSAGLIPPAAEVLVLSTTADGSTSTEDEPETPPPTYPYPPINGGPPLYPPNIPGGPLGPG